MIFERDDLLLQDFIIFKMFCPICGRISEHEISHYSEAKEINGLVKRGKCLTCEHKHPLFPKEVEKYNVEYERYYENEMIKIKANQIRLRQIELEKQEAKRHTPTIRELCGLTAVSLIVDDVYESHVYKQEQPIVHDDVQEVERFGGGEFLGGGAEESSFPLSEPYESDDSNNNFNCED